MNAFGFTRIQPMETTVFHLRFLDLPRCPVFEYGLATSSLDPPRSREPPVDAPREALGAAALGRGGPAEALGSEA